MGGAIRTLLLLGNDGRLLWNTTSFLFLGRLVRNMSGPGRMGFGRITLLYWRSRHPSRLLVFRLRPPQTRIFCEYYKRPSVIFALLLMVNASHLGHRGTLDDAEMPMDFPRPVGENPRCCCHGRHGKVHDGCSHLGDENQVDHLIAII